MISGVMVAFLFAVAAPAESFDIVVYGATPGGIAAAVQAADEGRRIALIEPSGRIGGMTTGGLGMTDFGNLESIQGLARRFYKDIRKWYDDPAHWKQEGRSDFLKRANSNRLANPKEEMFWRFEPSAALAVLKRWVARPEISLYVNERLDRSAEGVEKCGAEIKSIKMLSGRKFVAKVFIDATYEGDLMAASGVSYVVGRESREEFGERLAGTQPRRGVLKLENGIDPYRIAGDPSSGLLAHVVPKIPPEGAGGPEIQAYCYRMCLTDDPANRIPFSKPEGFDESEYELLFRNFAAEKGRFGVPWLNDAMPNRKTDTNNTRGFSTDYVGMNYRWPEGSYDERERIAKRHLVYQQGLMWVLANHPRVPEKIRKEVSRWGVCKDEFAENGGWPTQLYVREARRMRGEYVMTEHDCVGVRTAPKPIAFGSYGLDSHNIRRYVTEEGFVQNEGELHEIAQTPPEARGVKVRKPYPISYGAIVPKRSECTNLIVPVCLSATHVAFGSIRMEPVYFAVGQAAGSAAALATWRNLAVQDVDYREIGQDKAANPIFPGWYADPQIRKFGDEYWIFPTYSHEYEEQTFLDAFSSKDLKTWTKHHAVLKAEDVPWAHYCLWAPDIQEKDGKYYLFFAANEPRPVENEISSALADLQSMEKLTAQPFGHRKYGGIGVAVADRPEGPYRDLIGKPLVDQFWNKAQPIDQYVFAYKGEWYMVYGGWGRCTLVKLADDFKSLLPLDDGRMWRDITPKGYVEGSVMFERAGKWYFMYSSGDWMRDSYCVNYSIGNSPFGPFEFKGSVLSSHRPIATGAGHNSVINIPGTDDWYICYHRRPIPSLSPHHRVTCIDQLKFDANGDILPVVVTSRGE